VVLVKFCIMNKNYELTLLARADVSDEDIKISLQTLKDIIISNGGSIIYAEYWGMRQLEYKINKNENATFYMIQINSNKEINAILEEKLRNSDIFIRYLLIVCNKEDLNVKTSNCLTSNDQNEEGVYFDRRYYNLVSSVFNVK